MTTPLASDPRAAQKLDTRHRLLHAAQRLFARQGVEATTVDQIAREASTSRANFYLHFTGKDDVLHALRREMWQMALGFYQDFSGLPDLDLRTVRRWLARVERLWNADGGLTRIVLGATPQAVQQEYQEHLREYIDALTANPAKWSRFAPEEARRRAYLLIVQLERCMNDHDHIDPPVGRAHVLDTLAAIWVATVKPPTH
jgi:AcrR family transcriptional regulator